MDYLKRRVKNICSESFLNLQLSVVMVKSKLAYSVIKTCSNKIEFLENTITADKKILNKKYWISYHFCNITTLVGFRFTLFVCWTDIKLN